MKFVWCVALLLLSCIFFAYPFHSRVVLSGKFFDLSIGSTKEEIMRVLHEKPIEAVEGSNGPDLTIRPVNLDQLSDLANYDRIFVRRASSVTEIFLTEGVVESVNSEFSHDLTVEVRSGQKFSEVLEALRKLNMASGEITITGQSKGFGNDYTRYHVNLSQNDVKISNLGVKWLLAKDIWRFRTKEGNKQFVLLFKGNRLKEIKYKNYFIELP